LDKISAPELSNTLQNLNGELALLDVREEGVFARGHILLASSLPLSRLEIDVHRLVPRRATRIVLCDDHDGLAQTAAALLLTVGYANVALLDGGMAAWAAAGFEMFFGLNAPSKGLGVFAAKELSIPEIEADELAALQEKGADIQIVDCRPLNEYQRGSIPGALNSPGVELLRQFAGRSLGKHLVITCAGRTRGLLGAQSLIDAGLTGKITALHNGTMGWELSGRTLEKNSERVLDDSHKEINSAIKIAENIRTRAGIVVADANDLDGWRKDESRTTYLFDIRTRKEFEAGHLLGARHVVGGQLVQNLDQHVGTLDARIVLSDDDTVRASAVALWLRRMGREEVAIAPIALDAKLEINEPPNYSPTPSDVQYIAPGELGKRLKEKNILLIDLSSSRAYKAGHISGAYFAIRSRLAKTLRSLPAATALVFTSEDGSKAAFACNDGLAFDGEILALSGGNKAWADAGFPFSTSTERFADRQDDVMLKPSELSEGRTEAMREYLSGADDLLEKVGRDASLRLNALPIV
jgi:rhodanese-related sulfurtransferase